MNKDKSKDKLQYSQYSVKFFSLCWITGGHTIHPTIEELLPPSDKGPTPFRNSTSKVAGLQMDATTRPGLRVHLGAFFCRT